MEKAIAPYLILSNQLLTKDLEELKEILADIESRIKRFTAQKKKLG